MHSILTREPALQDFAHRLLCEPYFRDGTLTLYSDVTVSALHYAQLYHVSAENLFSCPDKYRDVCLDLLVCRGDSALLAVCFDEGPAQHQRMFHAYLHGLDYLRYNLFEMDSASLEALYKEVTDQLRLLADYQLTGCLYTLPSVRALPGMAELREKGFLLDDALSLLYTRDQGVFFQCSLTDAGALEKVPVTSAVMAFDLRDALNWQPETPGKSDTLRFLLDIPLTMLFQTLPSSLDVLMEHLAAAKCSLAFPEEFEVCTYGDCLRVLQAIKTYSKELSAERRDDKLVYLHDTILFTLAGVFAKGVPFFQMTLEEYFHAAAVLTGCYYPIWLYEHHYENHLAKREGAFTVTEYISLCQGDILFSPHSAQVCAALRELLLAPVSVPNAQ